jgi:hypothetical protein
MLTALHLGNFKAFAETQHIPVRPLTLIFGANSSGKSSIIHSLLLARQALEDGNLDVYRTKLSGESVDLGGFRQYVHRHDTTTQAEFGFELPLPERSPVRQFAADAETIGFKFIIGLDREDQFRTPRVLRFELQAGGTSVVCLEAGQKGRLFLAAGQREFLRRLDDAFREAEELDAHADGVVLRDIPELSDLPELPELSDSLEKDYRKFPYSTKHFVPEPMSPFKERIIWEQSYEPPRLDYKDRWFRLDDFFGSVGAELHACIEKVRYLGSPRWYPPRGPIAIDDQDPTWLSGGGETWVRLCRDSEARNAVNAALSRLKTSYQLQVHELVDRKNLEKVEAAELVFVDDQDVVLSHRDIGRGVSQVVPVLTVATTSRNEIITVEHPEMDLHPAGQAELADVFIKSALGQRQTGNTFLLETHSEHLILRIIRRMRETHEGKLPKDVPGVHPDDVSVLYVQRDGGRSIVRTMPLNEKGELLKSWPGGFFEEGLRDVLA